MEHWEALKAGGFRFVWDDALFRPGTDTFLLSAFPRLKPRLRVCDLGSGTGLLGLLLLQRELSLDVTGLELQPQAAALAERCAAENGLSGRMRTLLLDLRAAKTAFPPGSFDLAVSNPPYFPPGQGALPAAEALRLARSETACTLEDVVHAAAHLVRWGGAFCMVQKPERLTDALCALREGGCEPKRARFVVPRWTAAPSLVLLEGRRGGKPGLSIEPPLCLEDREALDRIYFRTP